MTALIIIAAIFLLITALLLLPVTLHLKAEGGTFSAELFVAGRIKLYPKKSEKPPQQNEENQPQKTGGSAIIDYAAGLGFTFSEWMEILSAAIKALGRLAGKLKASVFKLRCIVSAPDPYDAVLRFNLVNAATYTLLPIARRSLGISGEDVYIGADFDSEKTLISLDCRLYLRIGALLLAPLLILAAVIRIDIRHIIERIRERKALKWKTNSAS